MATPIVKKKREDPDLPQIVTNKGTFRYWESRLHRFLYRVIKHSAFEGGMGMAIVFNVIIMIVDTDLQTTCDELTDDSCGGGWTSDCNTALLLLYTAELILRFYVQREKVFRNGWFALDLLIVITGFVEWFVKETPNLQMLRLFRIMRLSRVVKMLRHFPTLYLLLRGFQGAMEAIAWGVMLILVLLLLWAIVAVELLHKDNASLEHDDVWCAEAFSSVLRTVLYFFQTLVAGDSWGACSIPIMRVNAWAVFIFGGALVTVQLGFTNLILAIIVDQAVMAREEDNEALIKAKQKQKHEFAMHLKQVLEQADHDNSGTLSLDEMRDAYDQDSFVRTSMDMLDVDRHDLATLFHFMGGDQDGEVSYNKFVEVFSKCQTQDMRVYLMGMKLQIEQLYSLLHQHTRGGPPIMHQQSRDLLFPGRPTHPEPPPEAQLDGSWDDVAQETMPSSQKPSSEPFVPPSRVVADAGGGGGGSDLRIPDLRTLDTKLAGGSDEARSSVRYSDISNFELEMERLQQRLEIRLRDLAAEVVISATEMANLARAAPPTSEGKLDDLNCWEKWQGQRQTLRVEPSPRTTTSPKRASNNDSSNNNSNSNNPNPNPNPSANASRLAGHSRSPSPKPPPLQPPRPLQWSQLPATQAPTQSFSRLTGTGTGQGPGTGQVPGTGQGQAPPPQLQQEQQQLGTAIPTPRLDHGSSAEASSREKLEREPTIASAHTPPFDVI